MSPLFVHRHTKKWRGMMLYPPNRLSVRPSVRPAVRPSALRFRTLTSSFSPIFFKLCMDINIEEEWSVIANGLNSFINNRVMALD